MLLNLSNHPSSHWPDNQKSVALEQFGEIADLSFPAIDPEDDTYKIQKRAIEYANIVMQQFQGQNIKAVHLMGEMTFTLALTACLQKQGIQVYCSTTRRNVIEEKDGKKTTRFEFVRFRAYPPLEDT